MRDTHAAARDASLQAAMQNHFELFGLAQSFALDAAALERAYRDIQARVHPDRHAGGGDAARRAAMQWTTRVNEAYRTLRSPLERARYLLELNGVDVGFETNTAMPADFLVQQMALRESLEEALEARDAAALGRLRAGLDEARRATEREIAGCIDGRGDYAAASGAVRRLKFLERLDGEIDAALDKVEG